VLATLRSGEREQKTIEEKLGSFYGQLEKVAMDRLSVEQGERLVQEVRKPERISKFDGTPGSILLDLEDMKTRYQGLNEEQKSTIRALKLLYTAGIYSFTKARLKCVLVQMWKADLSKPGSLDSALHELEKVGLLSLGEELVQVYPVYLEEVVDDYPNPKEDFENLGKSLEVCKDGEGLFYLGNTAYLGKDLNGAETWYKKTLGIKEEFAEAHNNYGILLRQMKRPEDAEKEYKRALALREDNAEAHNNYGVLRQR